MTNTTNLISSVIALLNANADYAVLRNFEGLPDRNDSRDIDIIITRKSLKAIEAALIERFVASGWDIVTYLNSDRLITFVVGHIEAGSVELVQWDFFVDTSVFGVTLMDASEFLKFKQFNGFLYYVDAECQFLDKFLYNRAVGAQYPAKYASTRRAAENSAVVEAKLRSIFGAESVEAAENMSSRKLLLRAVCWNLRHRPFGLIADVGRFLYTFIGNYFRSCTGFSIGFTGPDGSGKTTVIETMIKMLGPVFKSAHVLCHFRPTLFGNLGEVAHSAGLKKEVDRNYSDPHRGGRTGVLSSLARLCYYTLDYILGYWLKVKSQTRITRLVIFDRYFTDIICDSRRSRIFLPVKFLYFWKKMFIPNLDYNILLTADAETILERKGELDAEGIESINKKIDYLANKTGYYKVINDASPEDAVTTILDYIFESQHRRNMRRLGIKNVALES